MVEWRAQQFGVSYQLKAVGRHWQLFLVFSLLQGHCERWVLRVRQWDLVSETSTHQSRSQQRPPVFGPKSGSSFYLFKKIFDRFLFSHFFTF